MKTEYKIIRAHLLRTYKTHLLIRLNVVILYYLRRLGQVGKKKMEQILMNWYQFRKHSFYILLIGYHLGLNNRSNFTKIYS